MHGTAKCGRDINGLYVGLTRLSLDYLLFILISHT